MKLIFSKLHRYFQYGLQLSVLDMKKGVWTVESKISNIPYLKAENARGRHILIRPNPSSISNYTMVDDISIELLRKQHQTKNSNWKPGRLVVETSPNNYQVWIRTSIPLTLETKRYWLKRFHSDPGADPNNRWGRCPGFRNRKEKYKDANGGYPLSRLIWVDWKNVAVPTDIKQKLDIKSTVFSPQPLEGGVCHSHAICRSHYERGNESQTDFAYILALLRRGYKKNEIRHRILLERTNWHNHKSERKVNFYLDITIENARKVLRGDIGTNF